MTGSQSQDQVIEIYELALHDIANECSTSNYRRHGSADEAASYAKHRAENALKTFGKLSPAAERSA